MFRKRAMYPSRHRLRGNKEREPGNDDEDGGGDVSLHHVVRQLPGQVKLKIRWLLAKISITVKLISLKVKVILSKTTCNEGDVRNVVI